MMTVQPTDRHDLHRGDDEAERRHVVKQRALELKRALLESTLRLSPEQAAAAYNEAAQRARNAKLRSLPFLRVFVAVLSGALSTLVPIPSTCDLQGQLTMAEPSLAAASTGTIVDRRALVYAQPAQCARLSVDEPAAIFVEREGAEPIRVRGQIMQLAPRAGSGDAACQVELRLLAEHGELPVTGRLTAVIPMQASSWIAVLAAKATREDSFDRARSTIDGLAESAAQRSIALVEYLRNDQNARQHWETLRQIFTPDNSE
jgi:hypothetical protein